jgi:hypothetical protein
MSDPTVVHVGPANEPTMTLSNHNLLILHADSSHPLLTRIAFKIATLLRLSTSQHINLRWFLHYVFHPPALACFLIGFFGILSVQLQLLAIAPLEAKFHDQAAAATVDISNNIFASLNQSMYNQSALYANDINGHIDTVQSTVNNGLFGWVNGTTSTLNDTVNTFYSDLQDTVSTLFNGTFLEQPAQEFIKCIIGSKVNAIEDALTFLQDNLQINIPRVNESVLVISPDEVNAATQPIAAAAVGNNNDPGGGLVGRLINTYVQSLKKERVMFAIFLLLWFVVVIMALVIILWHSYGRRIGDSRGKQMSQRDQGTGFDRTVIPFREEKPTEARRAFPKTPITLTQIRRVEASDPGPMHSLSNLAPAATKSFDSFFDQASPAAAQPPEAGGVFTSLARKLPRGSGWRKHLTLALRRDKGAVRKSFHQAHRPQLTISTERPESVWTESLPVIERTSASIVDVEAEAERYSSMQQPEPKSTWWHSPVTPTFLVANPGARRKPSVPVSVGGETESAVPSPAGEVGPTTFVLPPHYAVARMVQASKLYIPPSPVSTGARAENPFKTPFDDDAGVLHSPVTAKSMTADISFLPVSAASKASDPAEVSFGAGRAF